MAAVFKRCACAEGVTDRKQQERIWKKCAHTATVQWRNGGRGSRLQVTTFKAKEYDGDQWGAAQRWAKKVDGAHAIAEVVKAPKRKQRSFREAAEKFLATRVGSKSTTSHYGYSLRNHVYDFEMDGVRFGELGETEVSREHVKMLVKHCERKFAPNTVASIYIAVSAVFADLRESKVIESSPCAKITLPAHVESRVFVSPSLEQLDILASRLHGPWQISVYLGHAAGMRIGEALAVRMNQLVEGDEGYVLRINRQVLKANTLAPLKHRNPDEFREVPVADFLYEKIMEHAEAYSIGEDGFLCPGKSAPHPHRPTYYEDFRDGVGAAELPEEFVFHWLRHDFAARCIRDSMPLPQLARIMGHKNSMITERVYWHLLQGSVASARQMLNQQYEQMRLAA